MSTPSATTPSHETATAPAPVPATMRAIVHDRYGTHEAVRAEQVPTPTPGRGEVLVRVGASSLNALDHHFLTGTPYFLRLVSGLRRPRHTIRGADVAGVVVAVGPDVTGIDLGARVFGECEHGAFADYVAVRARHVAPVPPGVSLAAAGATPVAGLTALQALRTHAAVQPGERVLVNGAAGGVGTFAVQIATASGAEVTAVCSTRNVEMVGALGAVEVVDYRKDDVTALGERFDVMVDNVGNLTPRECMGLLRPDGRYVAVSGPKDDRWLGPVPHLLRTGRAFRRDSRSFHRFTAAPDRDDLEVLGELLAAGRIVPAVERTVGLDGVADGLAEVATGHTRAKIVVVPG